MHLRDDIIDTGAECGDVVERLDVESAEELAGIGGRLRVGIHVDDVLAEKRAVQRAGEDADHQRQPVTLGAADRQQEAFIGPARIEQRFALAVDHVAFRHHLTALRQHLDLAVGRHRCRHVEDDGLFILGRDRNCDRVGRQQHRRAAPWRQVVGAANCGVDTDHVALHRHVRIDRGRAGMVAVMNTDPADTVCSSLFHGDFGTAADDQMAHAVVAVDEGGGVRLALDADVRRQVDAALPDAADIAGQAENAVRILAHQVGIGHPPRGRLGIRIRHADRHEGALHEIDSCCSRDHFHRIVTVWHIRFLSGSNAGPWSRRGRR